MIMLIRNRLALLQLVATAEARLTVRALPGVIRAVAPIVAWAALTIGMGVVIGFAAVALPPLGAFGLVVPFGLVLLWGCLTCRSFTQGLFAKPFSLLWSSNFASPITTWFSWETYLGFPSAGLPLPSLLLLCFSRWRVRPTFADASLSEPARLC